MIYGIGIDIVEIARIKKIIDISGDKLARRILRESELKMYYHEKYPVRFLSKHFAAKEAISKAFGTGMAKGITFKKFEIFNNDLGKPILRLFSEAAVLAKRLFLTNLHVTLSDTNLYACALVIFEKDDQ